MTDYFRYDVHFVMNITDIDDKVRSGCCASMAFAYDRPVCSIAFWPVLRRNETLSRPSRRSLTVFSCGFSLDSASRSSSAPAIIT